MGLGLLSKKSWWLKYKGLKYSFCLEAFMAILFVGEMSSWYLYKDWWKYVRTQGPVDIRGKLIVTKKIC